MKRQKTKRVMCRQGDILLVAIESIPLEAKPKPKRGHVILAEGEVTGHLHEILNPEVMSFLDEDRMYLKLMENSLLQHPEHGSIELPTGLYRMVRQREFTSEFVETFVND